MRRGMLPRGFIAVVHCLSGMASRGMSVVTRFLVVSTLMEFSRLTMMRGGVLV
jgi:hypothetical protein